MILTALIWYKVGTFAAFVLLGYAGGIVTGVKVAPPTEDVEIQFGKVKFKVKGRKNTVQDGLDVTNVADVATTIEPKKTLRERISERRAKRKENRKNK